ncbi:MAG: hypothetical protein ACUVRS_03265 [Armatimonadota bacterium]
MSMAAARKRTKVEGWELQVSETDAEVGRTTLRQRLADNNKLWAACFIGLVAIVLYFANVMGNSEQAANPFEDAVLRANIGSADDPAHREFTSQFVREFSDRFDILDAQFVGPDKFRIVVPASTSRDDVEFIAKAAGIKILTKLRFRPVVQVYNKKARDGMVLVATAQWQPQKYGFVVESPQLTE